jgi:acetyl-CoA C-acetyltransferase/acetyl-CoA acyltransferase
MEAFAVTIAKFLRDYPVDPAKVNVGGGHIARSHRWAPRAPSWSRRCSTRSIPRGTLGLVVCSGAAKSAPMVIERLN